jgi:aspartate/methionine/tyrosine aminotransferase
MAGLRSGFVTGGKRLVDAVKRLRRFAGAACPLPSLYAVTALWNDDEHVALNRTAYRKKFDIADALFTDFPNYQSPNAGFFLWLSVNDSEQAALSLWAQEGLRLLPGAYLSRIAPNVASEERDPGRRYLRVALVEPEARIVEGLQRLRNGLDRPSESIAPEE